MYKKVRIGIIGCGGIANSVHIPSLKKIESCVITAVCDMDFSKAERCSKNNNIKYVYQGYMELIKSGNVDAIFVLTPPDQLFRIAFNAIDNGLHVFMEKPAGVTSFQSKALALKNMNKTTILQIGFNRRFIPLVKYILNEFNNTKITSVNGSFVKYGSASFYDGCESSFICDSIHIIDLIRYVANSEVDTCATVTAQIEDVFTNAWSSVIKFKNGVISTLEANYQTGGRVHFLNIHGPGVSAYINLGFGSEGCDAKIIYANGEKSFSISSTGSSDNHIVFYDGKAIAGSENYSDYYGYFDEDKIFIESILTGKNLGVSIDDASKSMELAEILLKNILRK